jgi:hypothetical protein
MVSFARKGLISSFDRCAQCSCYRRGLARRVLRARPEEPAQAVAASTWHDVHMKVGHALTHDVVVRHERALYSERSRQHRSDALHSFEERPKVVDGKIGKCLHVGPRHDEDVSDEQRGAVQERDRDLVVEHDVRGRSAGDDLAEHACPVVHAHSLAR